MRWPLPTKLGSNAGTRNVQLGRRQTCSKAIRKTVLKLKQPLAPLFPLTPSLPILLDFRCFRISLFCSSSSGIGCWLKGFLLYHAIASIRLSPSMASVLAPGVLQRMLPVFAVRRKTGAWSQLLGHALFASACASLCLSVFSLCLALPFRKQKNLSMPAGFERPATEFRLQHHCQANCTYDR